MAVLILATTLALAWAPSRSIPPSGAPQTPAPAHVIAQPDALVWRGRAGGLQTAIAEGNPQAAGPFTMMLRLPDGVWIQPHFHNVDKRLVVIKGELLMGHGDTIDASKVTAIKTGGIAVVPARTHHYEGGRGETIVALVANGPFTTTMVQALLDVRQFMCDQVRQAIDDVLEPARPKRNQQSRRICESAASAAAEIPLRAISALSPGETWPK